LAVSGFFAQGCGSSSGDSTSAGVADVPTKAVFLKEANAICSRAEARRGAALKAALRGVVKSEVTEAEREDLVSDVALPVYAEMITELEKVDVPPGQEEKVDRIIQAMKDTVSRVEADPSSGQTGGGAVSKANELAYEYGLKRCVI
jgi:hypothetical protein